jgi:hypothetical protein
MSGVHNRAVNGFQQVPCPRCGSTANVHSIQELAALARAQLGQLPGGTPAPGQQLGGVPGYMQEPQPGQPLGGVPGYMQEPQPGQPRDPRGRQRLGYSGSGGRDATDFSLGDDLAGIAMSQAAKFIGRRIGRRMERTYTERIAPALDANAGDRLRTQIAIAERHPDICACLDDNVVFLTGGRAVLPMPNLNTLTVEQADAMVATLRQG